MYGQGTTGHYAMSQAYIVHEGWFSANVLLWITKGTNDYKDMLSGTFVNVTDMNSNFGGAYGLYDKRLGNGY
jgi:hypothetical protein